MSEITWKQIRTNLTNAGELCVRMRQQAQAAYAARQEKAGEQATAYLSAVQALYNAAQAAEAFVGAPHSAFFLAGERVLVKAQAQHAVGETLNHLLYAENYLRQSVSPLIPGPTWVRGFAQAPTN